MDSCGGIYADDTCNKVGMIFNGEEGRGKLED